MEKEWIPYGKQSVNEADITAVSEALRAPAITRGPKVEAFEKAVAEYCGATDAVAFTSGTAALNAACLAANVTPYDRILTTPNSFVATISGPMNLGATPVFVDVDPKTGNIDLDLFGCAAISHKHSRGKQIWMPVHFGGIAVDMEALNQHNSDPETVVIEDAAHALGSHYPDGQRVGSCSHSDMTVFSFHPIKNITTGEGGMVTTNDPDLAHRLRRVRNSGIERSHDFDPGYYEVQELSTNSNFTEMQAALGLSQLQRLDQFVKKRRELVARYRKELSGKPHISCFTDTYDASTAFHLFVVQVDFEACNTTRPAVMKALEKLGIGTQVHYIPLYRHPFFKRKNGDISEFFPHMEKYYSQALTLPLFYDLSKDEVSRIVKNLLDVLG